jgi:hypothetical protein
VTMLMSSYGTVERCGDDRPRTWTENGVTKRTSFKYPEVVYNHYQNRHYIDDHNSRRHQPISFEETWATKQWTHRVFAFLFAVTEGNVFLMNKRMNKDNAEDDILRFRRAFAIELINNPYMKKEEPLSATKAKRKRLVTVHELKTLPRGQKFSGSTMVDSLSAYPQGRCNDCSKRIRTFCSCSPGIYRCNVCFATHFKDCET